MHTPSASAHLDMSAPLSGMAHNDGKKKQRGALPPERLLPSVGVGANGRVVLWEHPLVFMGHAASDALLALEKPWEEVLQGLPLPLHRHIYGT